MGQALIIRKHVDGTRSFEGELPGEHVFPARWIQREIGDLCEVKITVKTSGGKADYNVTGFLVEQDEDGNEVVNFTGLVATRED